jgi:hypothetical protein
MLGLSRHIDKIHAMMQRANRDDSWINDAFSQSYSLEDLSGEIVGEMEVSSNLIRDAYVTLCRVYLIVTNKAGREIRIKFNDIPALKRIDYRDRDRFEIQGNGSCLYWSAADIHLDFESFLYYVDDQFRAKTNEKSERYRREYGKAIAIVRTVYQIPIEAIDGLTSYEVQDIEAGRIIARVSSLCCYSEAIGITLDEFLDKVAANVDILEALK